MLAGIIMPVCKKCGTSFPNKKIIDGKERCLHKRTLCLNCSPFNAKKTGIKNNRKLISKNFTCKTCGKEFIQKTRNLECTTCRNKALRLKNKLKIFEKLGNKCIICGYDKCHEALDLHHLDPKKKEFSLSSAYHLSLTKLLQEAEKCILLCARCHRELHAGVVKLGETQQT